MLRDILTVCKGRLIWPICNRKISDLWTKLYQLKLQINNYVNLMIIYTYFT